jgi:hypothetical protein
MLSHALRVIHIVKRAAAMLRWPVALKFRKPPLIPKLHSQPDDRSPVLQEQSRNRRRIDPTRHGHGDQAGLQLRSRGQRIDLHLCGHCCSILAAYARTLHF